MFIEDGELSPNFFLNPSEQRLICIPPEEEEPVNCGDDNPPKQFIITKTPESTSPLSLLAIGTLSAASTLKRKQKPSKEKELEKIS